MDVWRRGHLRKQQYPFTSTEGSVTVGKFSSHCELLKIETSAQTKKLLQAMAERLAEVCQRRKGTTTINVTSTRQANLPALGPRTRSDDTHPYVGRTKGARGVQRQSCRPQICAKCTKRAAVQTTRQGDQCAAHCATRIARHLRE